MMRARRRPAAAAAVVLGILTAAGCTADQTAAPSPSADAAGLSGELTVFAAASLSLAFDDLATEFEARHPGVDVRPIVYDGSSVLTTQLLQGAEADVFASADEKNLRSITEAGLAGDGEAFATNTLRIAVAPGNPHGIDGLADLADPALSVVLCAKEVPCGAASHRLLDAEGVGLTPASEEQNVTATLAKVSSGEADAGLVYATDILAAGDRATGIEIDGAEAATNVYPIVALTDAKNPAAAQAFVEFVLSPDGRAVLQRLGFGAP